jgi:putative copper resistance protein D
VRYTGPPTPTWPSALTAWHLDPVLLVIILLAVAGYLGAVRRVRRGGEPWPLVRTVTFVVLGVGSLAETALGWPGVYAPVLFSVYALQVVALLMVVPLLLALGRPIELAKIALRPVAAARLDRALASRAARLFTVPVVSPILLAVIPFLIFFTPWYQASLAQPAVGSATRVALLLIGLAVLVPIWESDTIGARIPYVIVMLFALIELLADAVPGIVIRLDTHVIASGYLAALARPWGPSLLTDQQRGGDLLWCVGEAVDAPFLGLILLQWWRSDVSDARRIDEALDRAERAETGAGRATAVAGTPVGDRPWWETDASVFGDRANQFERPGSPTS